MPSFVTKYGQKEFAYGSLDELKKAIADHSEKISFPVVEHDWFGEKVTELDISSLHVTDCAFGSEQQTIACVSMMIENYEKSDSAMTIVDFYNQNHLQYLVLGGRARNALVHCHALQKQLEQYRETNAGPLQLVTLLSGINQLLQQTIAFNNTSIAANLCNQIILEGEKALNSLHGFNDNFTNDLNETIKEFKETSQEIEDMIERMT